MDETLFASNVPPYVAVNVSKSMTPLPRGWALRHKCSPASSQLPTKRHKKHELCFLCRRLPGLLMRTELVAVQVFFLYEPDRHHTILLESSIKLAAIDSECGCGAHLISTKLL